MNDRYDETRSVVTMFGALHVRRCTRCGSLVDPDSIGVHDAHHDRIEALS